MMHLLTFLLALGGFAALAAATDRAQVTLFRRELPASTSRALRACGWGALAAGLAVIVTAQGWPMGLVSFSGHTSLAAGLVFAGLILVDRRTSPRR